MEVRIYEKDGIFWVENFAQRQSKPWPPELPYDGEAELTIRLRSTNAGNAARWKCGEKAKQALNEAPYEPVFRGVVTGFTWTPFGKKGPWFPCIEDDEIVQAGSGVLNWRAKVVRPIEDPIRPLLSKLQRPTEEAWKKQGHLAVFGLTEYEAADALELVPLLSVEWVRFYNHFIGRIEKYAWRVIERQAVAIIKTRDGAWVLSPDHPNEPLYLAEGCYLLSHPMPSGRKVD